MRRGKPGEAPHTPRAGDEVMTFRRTFRGDIAQILNPLVVDGTIKGFSTNLYEKPLPEQVIVTVVAGSTKEAEEVQPKVSQALASLGQHILVKVDLREELRGQEPEGGL